jgi:hypothetical protein
MYVETKKLQACPKDATGLLSINIYVLDVGKIRYSGEQCSKDPPGKKPCQNNPGLGTGTSFNTGTLKV